MLYWGRGVIVLWYWMSLCQQQRGWCVLFLAMVADRCLRLHAVNVKFRMAVCALRGIPVGKMLECS